MYFHRVSSRHWPSPLTLQDAATDCARLVADKLANGKEPKEARQGCAPSRYERLGPYGAQAALIAIEYTP